MNDMKNENRSWDFNFLDADTNEKLLQYFKGERSGFLQVGPKKYFLPQKFAQDLGKYYNFKPRPEDVWIVTFPRSGTTWTQEMIWLLANNLDYEEASKIPLLKRFPFLEFSSCVHNEILDEFLKNAKTDEIREELGKACGPIIDDLNNTTKPRFIKTHLPFSLLPPDLLTCGAKVVYVARNPKDVAVSYYNFHQFIKTLDFVGDFKTFWHFFEKNLELWTPYWSHIFEGWEKRCNRNFLFLFYEDIKKDLLGNIKKVATLLNKQYSEEEFVKLAHHLDFDNFRSNTSVNMEILRDFGMLLDNDQKCVRNGKPGNWKELFTEALNFRANKWISEHLKATNIEVPWEI